MKSIPQESYMTGKDVQKENERSFNPSNKFAFTFCKFLPGYIDLTNSWYIYWKRTRAFSHFIESEDLVLFISE